MKASLCHPERKHYSLGLCKSCYSRQHYANNPDYAAKTRAANRKYEIENADKVLAKRRLRLSDPVVQQRYSRRERNARLRCIGLEEGGVERLREIQDNTCPICLRNLSTVARDHVDHDHKTGRVRGLLCSRCNNGIGMLLDDPELLRRAARYLESPPANDLD